MLPEMFLFPQDGEGLVYSLDSSQPFMILNARLERSSFLEDDEEEWWDVWGASLPALHYAFLVAGTIEATQGEASPLQCWFDMDADSGIDLSVVRAAIEFMEANGAHAEDVARLRAAEKRYESALQRTDEEYEAVCEERTC